MPRSLRVAVAEDEREVRDNYARILSDMGHEVVVLAATGWEFVEQCYSARPDLLIVDIVMPGLNGIEATGQICGDEPIPTIFVSAHADPKLIERAQAKHVLGYLVKPFKEANLRAAIQTAMTQFEEKETLRRDVENAIQAANDAKQALEDRKLVERARYRLKKKYRIDDDAQAIRLLQKMASQSNQNLADAARSVLGDSG